MSTTFSDRVISELTEVASLDDVHPEAKAKAIALAMALPDALLEHCTVSASAWGCALMEWYKNSHRRVVELEVSQDGIVEYIQWVPMRGAVGEGKFLVGDVEKAKQVVQWFFEDDK